MQGFVRRDAQGSPLPVIASVPHSGVYVPEAIAARFAAAHRSALPDTDWFLPEVYAFLPELGITSLAATHSRYVADLNRDPARELFGGFFDAVVAARTADGREIYDTPPDPAELATRIARYHEPYHRALRELLDDRLARFSRVLLLDLHSYMVPVDHEICLGDGRGTTCAAAVTASFTRALRGQGFDVVVNAPYTGGFVVRSHARTKGVSALQIELRYPMYMDTAAIDAPLQPVADAQRIAAVQPRLRAAIEQAVTAFLESAPLDESASGDG